MRCICGEIMIQHVCSLSHRERMIRYADYCVKNNNKNIIKNICDVSTVTPFSHPFNGCVVDGIMLERKNYYYDHIYSTSKNHDKICANACDSCFNNKLENYKYYCFVNMETPSVCRATKPLRVLLIRELYNQHKVPRDIRNLINSLLSCGC